MASRAAGFPSNPQGDIMAKDEFKSELKLGEKTAEVTYVDEDGPSRTVCWGIDFRLNVPVTVPYSRTVESLIRKETAGPEGEPRSRGVPGRISVVELARGNPCFMVDGVRPERKIGMQRLPIDADQYRGYALGWVRQSNTLRQLDERWEGEAPLREKCGCEAKDENYLRPFLDARRDQLKEAA
jgi:hypothetical protein